MKKKNIAIILSAGKGNRSELPYPKQFLKIAGKSLLEHTLDLFQKNKLIDEIAIVADDIYHDFIWDIVHKGNYFKCKKIILGGSERYLSTYSAIKAYYTGNNDINLIIHDAVRPLLSQRIINECVTSLEKYDAVDVAIPSSDTIIKVTNNILEEVPEREKYWRGQTPQCFNLNILKDAYDKAMMDKNFSTTDDCKVIKKYLPNVKIHVIKGDYGNIKLTYPEDIWYIDKLFQIKLEKHSNLFSKNFNLKKIKNKNIVIFGGTSGIGQEINTIAKKYGANVYSFSKRNGINITNPNAVRKALKSINNNIDIIFVIAAKLDKNPISFMSYKTINEILDTNLKGSIIVAKESLRYLKKSKGTIIFFSSSSYTMGRKFYSPYSASKAGIVNLTQALADEWFDFGIKVNCVSPSRTQTPMRTKVFGVEDSKTLLDPKKVAIISLKVSTSEYSGQIIDIK